MYKETNIRSIFKSISWRLLATFTTVLIVYFFFGRLDLAIATGILESILKIILYWGHERFWHKIRWGKKKIKPFNICFTGVCSFEIVQIADNVFKELNKLQIPIERLDGENIKSIIPLIVNSKDDEFMYLERIESFIKILQKNSISTVSTFSSLSEEYQLVTSKMLTNNIVVYLKNSLTNSKDIMLKSQYNSFSNMNNVSCLSKNSEIIIDTEILNNDEATKVIVEFVKIKYIKTKFK